MIRFRFGALALLLTGLAACQMTGGQATVARPSEPNPATLPMTSEASPASIDWASAGDCLGMLSLLRRGLDDGRIADVDGTPFLLISDDPGGSDRRWPAWRPSANSQAGTTSPVSEARCVLRVGRASEHQSDHRILDREQVRSRYQSGTRREKNPAYDVAKARLRQAEKAAKPGKSSIVKVGDPLIDLVGTLIGGALTGFGRLGEGDQLEKALDTLAATPASIDHPVYKSYRFERRRVRASRTAVIPVTLTDRQLQQSWSISLQRREHRDLSVVSGLDRQDEDFAQHRQNSLTEDGLRQWLSEAPGAPLAEIAVGLLDRPSLSPLDRLALANAHRDHADMPPIDGDLSLDAAVLPTPGMLDHPVDVARPTLSERPASRGPIQGQIKVIGETKEAGAVFIAPHMILVPSDVIGERGLVDIESGPGDVALGLVAAVDHGLGLALIQAPLPGEPVMVDAWHAEGAMRRAGSASRTSKTAPLLVNGRLTGFRTAQGPDIEGDAIQAFLDSQQHLLPPAP
ncbi:MAG: hypothetical protein AAF543_03130 [Pseudomonadota bacterium]